MITNLVLIEHPTHKETLYPFSILHLPWELRYGAMTLVETWIRLTGASLLECVGRPAHCASCSARYPEYGGYQLGVGRVLIASSRLLPSKHVVKEIAHAASSTNDPVCYFVHNELVALVCSFHEWEQLTVSDWYQLEQIASTRSWVAKKLTCAHQLTYVWDLFDRIGDVITEQYEYFAESEQDTSNRGAECTVLLNEDAIAIGEGSSIAPMVVLDASRGPIIIGNNVTIMPHSTIFGPCAIGDHAVIKAGATIYPNTTIGRWCKVGGEIECSIFQDYSNKQHDGFVGHSFISEWVNIGAGANTSNLKNTYRPISVELPSGKIATGRTFLGLLCGDHTKAGIATMFSTGTVVGICANIFGAGYTPTSISSFTWGAISGKKLYEIETALDTARRSMARRGRHLLAEEEILIRREFERIAAEYQHT